MFLLPMCSFGNVSGTFSPFVLSQTSTELTSNTDSISTILADSTWSAPKPSINPAKAMYHSMFIPGWGQINNGKKLKAVLFFTAEVIFIGGYVYENYNVKNKAVTSWERDNYRTDRNTFFIYWMVSRIIGMVDAYVDAQLADFNVDDITPVDLPKHEAK